MNKIYQKSLPAGKNAGFTLIELLVVVLIIGILSAIALPQYEKAVVKARTINAIETGESIVRASEVYYLANGKYSPIVDDLDISLSQCAEISGTSRSVIKCDDYFMIDLLSADIEAATKGDLQLFYCPGAEDWEACREKADFVYLINFNVHPSAPNRRVCNVRTDKGRVYCKAISSIK